MKLFGKTLSKKTKRDLILRLLSIIIAGVLLLFFSIFSFGWFVSQRTTAVTSMKVTVSTDRYDLLVNRTTTFDSGYEEITGAVGKTGLKSILASLGFDLTETNTADAADIAYEMVNEYVWDGQRYLQPGAYGTVTFYLRPKTGVTECTGHFALDLGAYAYVYDEIEDESVMTAVTSESVLDLLKGHILFFTTRTGADHEHYVYSGHVDGSFTYDTSTHSLCDEVGKTDCYKIVLYWEWPTNNGDLTNASKYTDVSTYIAAHPEYFYANGTTPANTQEAGNQYNDGDTLIGTKTDCIVLYIDAK